MPSAIERTIAAQRRDLDRQEVPVRGRMRLAYSDAIDRLELDLTLMQNRMQEARDAGEAINPDWLRREARYQRLITQAELQFQRFGGDAVTVIQDGQRSFALAGAQAAGAQLDAVGIAFESNINTLAAENLVSSFAPDSPLRGVIDSYGTNAAGVIERELTNGIIGGKSASAMVRSIRRALGDDLTNARLDALVRTEAMRSYRSSLSQQYKQVGHLLKGLRWTATKSVRTCLACLAMDGRIFDLDYVMAAHVNCRCILSPVPANSYIDMIEVGDRWFARQPVETQRSMLGSQAATEAYQAGQVGLKDFVGRRRDTVWGPSVYQRSWRQVERHKWPDGNRPAVEPRPQREEIDEPLVSVREWAA